MYTCPKCGGTPRESERWNVCVCSDEGIIDFGLNYRRHEKIEPGGFDAWKKDVEAARLQCMDFISERREYTSEELIEEIEGLF